MTVLPPFTVPRDGATPVTRGISSNMKLGRTKGPAAVDPGCVTSSAYAPDSSAGTSQCINAEDTTNAVAPTQPNLHCTSSKIKFRPVICTTLPPPLNATSGYATSTSIAGFTSTNTAFDSEAPTGRRS